MPQNPKKHENFTFFFQKPAILGIASRKGVIFDRVTLCFVTVSDFFSQKIATRCRSGTFFFDLFETVGYLEGHQCAPPLPCAAGGWARHSRFRDNLGSIFFSIKNRLFSISISIKSGLAVVWTHSRPKKKLRTFFFLRPE